MGTLLKSKEVETMEPAGTITLVLAGATILASCIKAFIADDYDEARRRNAQTAYDSAKAKGLQEIEDVKGKQDLTPAAEQLFKTLNDIRAILEGLFAFQQKGGAPETVLELTEQAKEVLRRLSEALKRERNLGSAGVILLSDLSSSF